MPELYEKVKENIKEYITKILDDRDDLYLWENKDRIIEKVTRELLEEEKIISCTEKETEAYKVFMGLTDNGDMLTYKQVGEKLNKHNARGLIRNANRKLISTLYQEILFEDTINLVKMSYNYNYNKGMILPEDIEIDNLRSIVYFEMDALKKLNINTVAEIISLKVSEITEIIGKLTKLSRRANYKDRVANNLVKAIHLLGFVFQGENGYEEQSEYFDKLRVIMKTEEENLVNNEDKTIKQELCLREELIDYYNTLCKKKNVLTKELNDIQNAIKETKEEIINKENKIRSRKI